MCIECLTGRVNANGRQAAFRCTICKAPFSTTTGRNRQAALIADIAAQAGALVYEGAAAPSPQVMGDDAFHDAELLAAVHEVVGEAIDAMELTIANGRRPLYHEPDLIPVEVFAHFSPRYREVINAYNDMVAAVTSRDHNELYE